MKPKNFPARKMLRQMIAQNIDPNTPESQAKLEAARAIRTKKYRGPKK